MRGVLLAGGTGSRLLPVTRATNKHLLPVGRRAMVEWPLLQLVEAGIDEVVVVSGREHLGALIAYLGTGTEWEVGLTYHVQPRPDGIGGALKAIPWSWWRAGGPVAVILGDNFFLDRERIADEILDWRQQGTGNLHLFGVEVENPSECGIAEMDGERVLTLEEKPERPRSSLAVTGLYLYREGSDLRWRLEGVDPSERGEVEITDLNRLYVQEKEAFLTRVPSGSWLDCGTWPGYERAQAIAQERG